MIPNIPKDDVPFGTNAEHNVEIRTWGTPRSFDFSPLHHVDIAEKNHIIDFERGVKVSGARFAFLRGMGAKLNRALMQYMLDFHTAKGDIELNPPYLVKAEAMQGVGQLPKFKDDVFCTLKGNEEDLYMIPTAEAPVTNYFADEILEESDLPIRFCAYSPCFRSEAGAAGKDTRGLIRMHQFEKVEMVRFATNEQADYELEAMVKRAEYLLQSLQLPYRVMLLCTGDMGASAQKTYDLEVWFPGQNVYREISSCSLFGDYQARRAKIRYRKSFNLDTKTTKNEYVVTLNGSGLPLGRTLVAILENFQNKDGSIDIPEALWPYMGDIKKIS